MSEVLPAGFRFSQGSLEDYEQCRRRFFLRHVAQLDWPAPATVEAEAWEAALGRGQLFHQLVHQDALGLDVSPTVQGSEIHCSRNGGGTTCCTRRRFRRDRHFRRSSSRSL